MRTLATGTLTAFALCGALVSLSPAMTTEVHAGTLGEPASPADHRIKRYYFDPHQVYEVNVAYNFNTTIILEEGEQVETILVGDQPSWETKSVNRKHVITVKPLDKVVEPTSMTVMTTRRVYTFLLRSHTPDYSVSNAAFRYHFDYPPETLTPEQVAARAAAEALALDQIGDLRGAADRAKRKGRAIYHGYSAAGDPILRPVVTFDDGKHTYIRLRDVSARPAIFAVNPDGTEKLVNTTQLADGTIQVHGVYPQLSLRDGDYLLCLFNAQLYDLSEGREKARRAGVLTHVRENHNDR